MSMRDVYSVAVQDGVILIAIIGTLTVEAVDRLHAEVGQMLARPQGPKDILVNIDKLKAPDKATVHAALKFLRSGDFHRVAIYGKTLPFLMLLTSKVIKSIGGDAERVKVFRDEAPARGWLAQSE